jgi:hypothetical protein
MIESATTHHRVLSNEEYPKITISWNKSNSLENPVFVGPDNWQGDAKVWWLKGSSEYVSFFTVNIGQTVPLGKIHYQINGTEYDAYDYSSIQGTGITERDLLWCGEWATATMKRDIITAFNEYKQQL